MSFDLSNLTTLAAVDSSIASAEDRKGVLVYRKTTIEHQLDNVGDLTEVTDKLQRNAYELAAAVTNVTNAADDETRAFWQSQVTVFTGRKTKLEKEVERGTEEAKQELNTKIGEYPILVSYYDEYLVALQARRAVLMAAAA